MKYLVQEFAAGQWFHTRSFETELEAVDWSKRYQKARIVKVGMPNKIISERSDVHAED